MRNTDQNPRILSPSADFHDCKMEQKECMDNCTILYCFASNDLHKFAILQEVFGACNVIKLIQDLPSEQRVEAIDSLAYQASARLQEPALGCVGTIQQLQSQISDLESQIISTEARIQKIHCQQAQLLALFPGFNNTREADDKYNPTTTSKHSTSLKDDDDGTSLKDDADDEDTDLSS